MTRRRRQTTDPALAGPSDAAEAAPGEIKSKSQRKREAASLTVLADQLVGLAPGALAPLELPAALTEAVNAARAMRQHGARRRQIRYIGKLLRALDSAAIVAAVDHLENAEARAASRFHGLERWRERLLANDAALEELLIENPQADRGALSALISEAHREAAAGAPPRAARRLFRYLREILRE